MRVKKFFGDVKLKAVKIIPFSTSKASNQLFNQS